MKKILFLDFDGVLNSDAYFGKLTKEEANEIGMKIREATVSDEIVASCLDTEKLKLLAELLEEVPDLKIVVSSSWRKRFPLQYIKKILKLKEFPYNNRILGGTPFKFTSYKCHEIPMWIDRFDSKNKNKYLVLDDENIFDQSFFSERLNIKFVQTDYTVGLTREDTKIIADFYRL